VSDVLDTVLSQARTPAFLGDWLCPCVVRVTVLWWALKKELVSLWNRAASEFVKMDSGHIPHSSSSLGT